MRNPVETQQARVVHRNLVLIQTQILTLVQVLLRCLGLRQVALVRYLPVHLVRPQIPERLLLFPQGCLLPCDSPLL